jgi:proline iminopeptidase
LTDFSDEVGGDGIWLEQMLPIADGRLAWAAPGTGPPLIFLHGGPGDEYRYLRTLAAPLLPDYRCVLFDQRGSGRSTLRELTAATVHPDRFVDDIDALRAQLRANQVGLVGHSWGAVLALLYGLAHPEHVAATVLIGMGPLNAEMAAVARANRLRHLPPPDRARYVRLSEERRVAIEAGDQVRIKELSRKRFRLTAPSLLYKLEQLDSFVENWLAAEPLRNWQVNRLVWSQVDFAALWEELPRLRSPVLTLYGHQDFEPIIQAYRLRERLPDLSVAFVNEAGHLPWLEQPAAVHAALRSFLWQNYR